MLGVSPDSASSHEQFRSKYDLPFTLLADPEHEVADLYGVWVEQTYGDKTWIGNERSTFVIDSEGKVASVLREVKPAEHADDVLKALA